MRIFGYSRCAILYILSPTCNIFSIFPYPAPDQPYCNISLSICYPGSTPLQPQYSKNAMHSATNFQYPQTDRLPCNVATHHPSSAGDQSFQYPQTDRYPCNPI